MRIICNSSVVIRLVTSRYQKRADFKTHILSSCRLPHLCAKVVVLFGVSWGRGDMGGGNHSGRHWRNLKKFIRSHLFIEFPVVWLNNLVSIKTTESNYLYLNFVYFPPFRRCLDSAAPGATVQLPPPLRSYAPDESLRTSFAPQRPNVGDVFLNPFLKQIYNL